MTAATTLSVSSSLLARRSQHPQSAFSHQTGSTLGSPFLTISELDVPRRISALDLDLVDGTLAAVPHSITVTRPPSPDFSIIHPPSPSLSELDYLNNTPTSRFLSRRRPLTIPKARRTSSSPSRPIRSILPRLLDALSSPARKVNSKAKLFVRDVRHWDSRHNHDDILPLDGKEGEEIDDEACFIDVQVVSGIGAHGLGSIVFSRVTSRVLPDILTTLPPELSLYLLSFLDLSSLLACMAVCKSWYALASDNSVWRSLFEGMRDRGWNVDLTRVAYRKPTQRDSDWLIKEGWWNNNNFSNNNSEPNSARPSQAIEEWSLRRSYSQSRTIISNGHGVNESFRTSCPSRCMSVAAQSHSTHILNWYHLYKTRYLLDQRWRSSLLSSSSSLGTGISHGGSFEPALTRLSGHGDSVYCLEFDSRFIITGSRDRSIMVWELHGGRRVGTFVGGDQGHKGSVLCLKFEREWHRLADGAKGFMVTGSSDCTVCVWDIWVGGRGVRASVKKVLKGHSGGVLDLRTCERWIVSCSKDALIRVWNRATLELHCTFRGHEGPVNAIGMEGRKVVSASGDGKMMLWEIPDETNVPCATPVGPIRIFEGNERGLACIDYKDDLIVSGSNDCMVKVWRASTGECLRTLVGHDQLVRALSFEPRSGRLVSASYDRTVKVWDLKTGRMVREFRGRHASHIFDVKFDIGRIVSTSHDQNIVILDFTQGLDASLFV